MSRFLLQLVLLGRIKLQSENDCGKNRNRRCVHSAMKRSKDNENEDISENNDDDVRPPPQKVPNVLIGVDIPKRNVAEAPPKLASVQVSLPQVAIRVQKPPSIWSRLWNIYSSAKPSSVHAHDGAPAEPTAPYEEAADSVGFHEKRQDSPRLGANVSDRPAEQQRTFAICANRDVEKSQPESPGNEELSEGRHSGTEGAYEPAYSYKPAYSASGSPKTCVRVDEVEKRRCESVPRTQADVDSIAVARVAVDKPPNCRSYGMCRRLKDESNYIGLSIFNALPEDQNVCLSIYGISFLIPLIDVHATDSRASFRETLKFGALVPKEGGQLARSCNEVVTTLRRRVADTGEVTVNTETYLRRYVAISQEDYGTPSTQNGAGHLMTAELIADDTASGVRNDVLFNTASFENLWKCPFNRNSTYTGSFFNNWTDQVRVQVMRKTGILPYSYYRDLDADVVCLPYADGALSMVLIAQRSPSSGPVRLTPDAVRGFVHGAVGTLVTLHLPKFRFSTSIDMADLMNKVASANCDSGRGRLAFLQLRQEAHVSADEGHWPLVSSERTLFSGDPTTIAVNKPFYFVVTDRTSDLILYTGRVMSL